jgi:hypothetical protein
MERTERTTPSFVANLNGIRLAVWENETDSRRWFSAMPSRRFVESGSTEAKYTSSFRGIGDLVILRQTIDMAIQWMTNREHGNEEE